MGHGKRKTYQAGCHCELCTSAYRSYSREYMALWRQGIALVDVTDERNWGK